MGSTAGAWRGFKTPNRDDCPRGARTLLLFDAILQRAFDNRKGGEAAFCVLAAARLCDGWPCTGLFLFDTLLLEAPRLATASV